MPIKVQCRCGRVMLVKDELAGKTGRCPECQKPVKIPYPGDEDEPAAAELVDEDETPRKRSQGVRSRRDEDDDYDDRPRRKRTAGRSRDDEDEDDDYDDRPRRKGKGERLGPVTGGTVTLLSIGIATLVLLALVMIARVYTVSISLSSSNKEIQDRLVEGKKLADAAFKNLEWPGFTSTWRGILILVFSILLAAVTVASLVLLFTVGRKVAEIFLICVSATCAGWGMLVLLWFLGYVFKGFAMSESRTMLEVRSSVNVWPGWGLLLGFLLAGGVVGVFSPLVFKRGALWGLIGLGVGGLAGLLLLLLDARPWENPSKEHEKAMKEYNKALGEYNRNFQENLRKGTKPPVQPKLERPWFFPEAFGGRMGSIRTIRSDSAFAEARTRTEEEQGLLPAFRNGRSLVERE